jgi:hypothetical protein
VVRKAWVGSPDWCTQVAAAVDDRTGGVHCNWREVPVGVHGGEAGQSRLLLLWSRYAVPRQRPVPIAPRESEKALTCA